MKKNLLLGLCIFLCSCGSGQLRENQEIQQQQIDDLTSQQKQISLKLQSQEEEVKELKKELSNLKQQVKKVRPDYVDGVTREGN